MVATSIKQGMLRHLSGVLFLLIAAHAADKPSAPRWSKLHIQSATLVTGSGVPIQLSNVDAQLPPKEFRGRPSIINSGFAFLSSESLTRLLNSKMSSDKLKDLKVETEHGQRAKISATMKKAGIPVPVSIEGPVSLNRDGMLRLEIDKQKAAGLPIKALADALGMSPEKQLKGKTKGNAVRMEKDAMLVDPQALLGVTAQGRVTGVSTNTKGLNLRFGPPAPAKQQARR